MELKEIMTTKPHVTNFDTTLEEAACIMRDHDIGPLPVRGEDGRISGILTDRDIAVRSTADGQDPRRTKVKDVMTTKVITCRMNDSIDDVAQEMKRNKVRRMLVIDDRNNFVGIASLGDVAQKVHDRKLKAELLQELSTPN